MDNDTTTSTSQDGPLPTFSSLRAAHQVASPSYFADRLHWTLSNPLSSSIFVMPNTHSPDPNTLVPYCITTANNSNNNDEDDQSTTLNPLAHELMTTPAVRSIEVNVCHLTDWEDDWKERHIEDCGPDAEQRRTVIVSADGDDNFDEEAGDMWDDDGNRVKLVMCCGEPRPEAGVPLEVRASDEARGVTIDDYVQAVHPWLMSKRDDIVAALDVWDLASAGAVLMVNIDALDSLIIEEKDTWVD